VALSLILMLVCLAMFSPRTIALFLGPGLFIGVLGILLYLLHVILDLRSRRIL
jgi:hypothetical protein